MKRIIALLLVFVMCFGLFAGCNRNEEPVESSDPSTESTPEVPADENLEKAVEYLRVYYKDAAEKTPMDYKRIGAVRIGTTSYPITWSVDISDELITIVDNGDGTVTIDINEEKQKETAEPTPYVLTAKLVGTDGREATYSWNHILPAGVDNEALAIIDAAYELENGQALEGTHTLTGLIVSIDTMYSDEYKNITVTIEVPGREDKPIQCYRLKGEGAELLAVGDTITVTGTLKNYNGTIEFDAGCVLEAVEPGGQAPVTAPEDPLEILKAAFALAPGKSLPYEATLTGTVVEVNTPYDSGYGNISVTIRTNGYRLLCYRLKGSGADQINVNDVITVKGQITNYYNVNDGSCTVEFNYPTLVGLTNYAAPAGPTDPTAIIDAAYSLPEGESLAYESTLTGVITKINTPYDSGYNNITVTIAVAGNESRPIMCYRLKGSGVADLAVGDTVTVTGYLKNYYGTIEFDAGCRASNIVKAPDPAEEAAKILDALYALEPGQSLEGEYSLTGKITEIGSAYSEQYGNITVTIVVEGHDDKPVVCFRMVGEGAGTLAVGDTITVTGGLTNYNGTYEFTAGCTFELVSKGENEGGDVVVEPTGTAEVMTELPADGDLIVIYNSGNAMTATPNGNKLSGEEAEIVEGVLELTETIAQLSVSIDENGYYTFICGDKYLTSGETGNSLTLADEASDYSLWTVEAATEGTWYIKNVNAKYMENVQSLEYYSGFTTYGHKDTEIYQMQILKVVEETAPIADGDQVVIYAPAYNKALSVTKTGFYNVGVDITVTEGVVEGFAETEIFTVIVNEDGTYSFVNGGQNIGLADQFASMDLGAVNDDWTLVDLGEGLYLIQNVVRGSYMEWYDSKNNWSTYASETAATDGQFQLSFYVIPAEEEPAVPTDPAEIIDAAYALEPGQSLNYAATLTGTITEIVTPYSEEYGNITVTIVVEGSEDQPIVCFRLKGEGAETLKVGDVITVTGTLTNYNGTVEFGSGCTLDAIAGEEEEPVVPATLAEQIAAAAALANGEYLPYESTITGTIVGEVQASTKNEGQYKFTVEDAEGNSLLCYYVPVTGGTPVEGDTVTVTGKLTAYNGSAQFDSTASATLAEKEEEPTVPATLAEQIAAAAALANSEYLPYESTITGTIVGEVQASSYDEGSYKFTVEDTDGNSLLCYYVPVTGGTPVEGNTVTVTGKLTAYNGSAQFDSTASATLAEKEEEPTVPATLAEQIAAAAALVNGEYLPYESTITGTIVGEVQASSYDEGSYKFTVEDTDGNSLLCYYVPVTGGTPVEGDTVTVTGKLTAYNGSAQFDKTASAVLAEKEEPEDPEPPVEPVVPTDPAEIIDAAYALESGASLDYVATLTGEIVEIGTEYSEQYGNITVTIVVEGSEDQPIVCFRLKGEGAETLEIGDTITVTGTLTNYNGTIEFTSGCTLDAVVKGGEEEPEAYYRGPFLMGMYQANLQKDLFFTGEMSGYYLATSENVEDAMLVTMEYIGDDIRLFFISDEGAQTFIEIQKVGDFVNVVLTTQPTMTYKENKEVGTLVANVEGTDYYLGTYKNYNTISPSKLSYITGDNASTIGVSNFPIQFADIVSYAGPFNLCMEQVNTGKTLYFAGYADGDYLATTEDPAEAADLVVVELYTGEAAIGFVDADGQTKFIEIYLNSSNKPRVRIVEEPESFFTYNSELGIYVTELNGQEYYLGTFNNYETIGASSTYYITGDNAANVGVSQFVAYLVVPSEEPDVPEAPEEPEVTDPTPAQIVEAAYNLAEGESLGGLYTLEGEITSIDTEYSEQYSNITVTIVVEGCEDKPIVCFRMKGEGAADLKVGDTITVTGDLINYGGTIEFDAGCQMTNVVVAPGVAPEETPEVAPEETPEVAPEETPEDDFVYIPDEETPEVAPEVTPEETPEVAPEVTPEQTPEAAPEEAPAA